MTALCSFLANTFWETLSQRSGLNIEDCKTQFPHIVERIKTGLLNHSDLSRQLQHALNYYVENWPAIKDIAHD